MDDPGKAIAEVRVIIHSIREYAQGRFFELGAESGPLRQIEEWLTQVLTSLNSCKSYYAVQSMEESNHYYNALRIVHQAQEDIKAIRTKGKGSRENTSRILRSINDLEESLDHLSTAENKWEVPVILKAPTTVKDKQGDLQEAVPNRGDFYKSLYAPSVFISYAWEKKSQEIADQLEISLQNRGISFVRDTNDLEYKGSIRKFMERIGRGNCIIVIISDKYLRSSNCMYELAEIAEGKQFYDRIFPIVLEDATIYDPVKRIEYVRYWEGKKAELSDAMKTVSLENLQGIHQEIDLYDRIRDKISSLTSILKDMYTLTPEMHRNSNFDKLYTALEKRLESN